MIEKLNICFGRESVHENMRVDSCELSTFMYRFLLFYPVYLYFGSLEYPILLGML